ncbi:hypothetical protein GCM10009616_34790 [Microlunatus lacustris]
MNRSDRMNRDVLARDAAARLDRAACREEQALWDAQECAHEAAETAGEARQAADSALALCVGCPVSQLCAAWAEVDQYTGLAAGQAWVNGNPRPAHWVRGGRTGRRLAS